MIDKTDQTRDDLIEAVHIMLHKHGSLWKPQPGCGCAEWVDTMLGNYDDIVNERESTAPAQRPASLPTFGIVYCPFDDGCSSRHYHVIDAREAKP
jgi:hypothetical protein